MSYHHCIFLVHTRKSIITYLSSATKRLILILIIQVHHHYVARLMHIQTVHYHHVDGLIQKGRDSIVNALELRHCCIKLSICSSNIND